MNTKVKVIVASLLVTSALAHVVHQKIITQWMDVYNYERTSYNDTHQYRDNVARNDRYTDYVTYRNGRNDTGYNYYRDVNYNGQIANPHPTRNITMNNSYINNDGKTAEKLRIV